MWKKERQSEFLVELSQQKLKKMEEFEEVMRNKLREKVRKLQSHETALEGLERRLKMKLAEMQKRENQIGSDDQCWQRPKSTAKRRSWRRR